MIAMQCSIFARGRGAAQTKLRNAGIALGLALLLGGCVTPLTPPAAPSVDSRDDQPPLRALTEIAEVKEELKRLRNLIEEIQFIAETTKRRQHNLFQDLDRRLLSLERAARLAASGSDAAAPPPNEDAPGDADALNAPDTGAAGSVIAPPPDPVAVAPAVSPQQQAEYDRAFGLLKQSKYQDAIAAFQQLAEAWPDGPLADDAYYWMAEARYVNREFEAALNGFQTVVARYPESSRVPEALLKIGTIKYDIGAYAEAADIFSDLLARFPAHQAAVSAQTRLRRIEQIIQ